jgi:hypothetical protein
VSRAYARLLLEMDPDLKEQLATRAVAERRSMRDIVIALIQEYLSKVQ